VLWKLCTTLIHGFSYNMTFQGCIVTRFRCTDWSVFDFCFFLFIFLVTCTILVWLKIYPNVAYCAVIVLSVNLVATIPPVSCQSTLDIHVCDDSCLCCGFTALFCSLPTVLAVCRYCHYSCKLFLHSVRLHVQEFLVALQYFCKEPLCILLDVISSCSHVQ